jgi:hypothetical protein
LIHLQSPVSDFEDPLQQQQPQQPRQQRKIGVNNLSSSTDSLSNNNNNDLLERRHSTLNSYQKTAQDPVADVHGTGTHSLPMDNRPLIQTNISRILV